MHNKEHLLGKFATCLRQGTVSDSKWVVDVSTRDELLDVLEQLMDCHEPPIREFVELTYKSEGFAQ